MKYVLPALGLPVNQAGEAALTRTIQKIASNQGKAGVPTLKEVLNTVRLSTTARTLAPQLRLFAGSVFEIPPRGRINTVAGLFTSKSSVIADPSRQLGSPGLEGAVFRRSDDTNRVIKVFKAGFHPEEDRLLFMMKHAPRRGEFFSWVDAFYRDSAGMLGFESRFAPGISAREFFLVQTRDEKYPSAHYGTYIDVVFKLASAYTSLHEEGWFGPDGNPDNTKIDATNPDDTQVTLIDLGGLGYDKKGEKIEHKYLLSMNYLPPYLLDAWVFGRPLKEAGVASDKFTLAIKIFEAVVGLHPFDCSNFPAEWKDAYSLRRMGVREDRIGDLLNDPTALLMYNNYFFYHLAMNDPRLANQPQIKAAKYLYDMLPKSMRDKFEAVFTNPNDPSKWPSAEAWEKELLSFKGKLKTCDVNPRHKKWGEVCAHCNRIEKARALGQGRKFKLLFQ